MKSVVHYSTSEVCALWRPNSGVTDAHLLGTGLALGFVARDNFPLPTLGIKLREFAQELYSGRGFFVLRTIPIDDYSRQELAIIFAGNGRTLENFCRFNDLHFSQVYQPMSVRRAVSKMEQAPSSHT